MNLKWQEDLVGDIRSFTEFDDQDGTMGPHPMGYSDSCEYYPGEISDCNRYHLLNQFIKVRDNAKAVLEIGIGRNGERSFAQVFFSSKKKDTFYIGLDINDRSFMRDPENNIHTIQNDSSNYYENVDMFKRYFNIEKFDFIFIDGWHSVNQILLDWQYTDLLTEDGIVGFHDVSCHPGPHKFIKSLDKNKWDVLENCCPQDWGIGFARKK
jgi:hypothetical protein